MIFDETNLPSVTRPYPVKQIDLREFRPKQLALMSKSVMLDDYQPAVDAMGQCMSNLDVNQLTTGDFFYLLAWQRINSLKRNPVYTNWECPGAVFVVRGTDEVLTPRSLQVMVENWESADEEARKELRDPDKIILDGDQCNHQNYTEVKMSDFSYVKLDADVVLDPRLDFPRCATLAEFVKLQRDPDVGMLAEAAQWIKHPGTLQERIQMLLDSEDTELLELACEANRDIKHGILRTFNKECVSCGHKHPLTFTIDPRAFFL